MHIVGVKIKRVARLFIDLFTLQVFYEQNIACGLFNLVYVSILKETCIAANTLPHILPFLMISFPSCLYDLRIS
ncbi:hypothetical protein Lalb_Chr13g0298251 [Lupinus albus]|uniref:Uncharacterized protein n=1 Tax=Lupinus albus TaxID=3870 RepID=A0A6A4PIV9_LUPAL|nr:hypothetical protein Lalb_Chr13g0298251 [Lupinus albus]